MTQIIIGRPDFTATLNGQCSLVVEVKLPTLKKDLTVRFNNGEQKARLVLQQLTGYL